MSGEIHATAILRRHLVLYVLTFAGASAFAIILPSVWPYMDSLNLDMSWLGVVVAAYSVGMLVCAPLWGYLVNSGYPFTSVLTVTLLLALVGNLAYALASNATHTLQLTTLITSRFIVGCSAGNIAVIRTYLAKHTSAGLERSRALSLVTGIQGVGFVLGPGAASLLGLVHGDLWGVFCLNSGTMPAYFSAIMAVVSLALIGRLDESPERDGDVPDATDDLFQPLFSGYESYTGTSTRLPSESESLISDASSSEHPKTQLQHVTEQERSVDASPAPQVVVYSPSSASSLLHDHKRYDKVMARRGSVLCVLCVFGISLVFTVFETILTPYTEHAFDWNVTRNGILFSALGAVSLFVQIMLTLDRSCSDLQLVIAGLVLQLASLVLLISYGSDSYVSLPRFLISSLLLVIGFSMTNALIYPVFSSLFPPGKQGTRMGTLTSVAAAARIVGPIVASPTFRFNHGLFIFMPFSVILFFFVIGPIVAGRHNLDPECRRHDSAPCLC